MLDYERIQRLGLEENRLGEDPELLERLVYEVVRRNDSANIEIIAPFLRRNPSMFTANALYLLISSNPQGILRVNPNDEYLSEVYFDWLIDQVKENKVRFDITSAGYYAQSLVDLRARDKKDPFSLQPLFEDDDGNISARPFTIEEFCKLRYYDALTEFDMEGNVRPRAKNRREMSQLLNKMINSQDTNDRLRLYAIYSDTCDGMSYESGIKRMCFVPKDKNLITLKEAFREPYISNSFDESEGTLLDRTNWRYNTFENLQEVAEQCPAWQVALPDAYFCEDYFNLTFSLMKRIHDHKTGMGFHVRTGQTQDERRAVWVIVLINQ